MGTDNDTKLEKIQETIDKAQDRVLFPDGTTIKAKICAEEVQLRPLPLKYAKILSKRLQVVVKGFQSRTQEFQENADMEIADALRDCLLTMVEFYDLEGIDVETVEEQMTLPEIKALVSAQAQINEDDDFLLMPLQSIIGILSTAKEAAKRVMQQTTTMEYEETLSGLQDLAKSSESASNT